MPKAIPAALQAHYDTGALSLSVGILIQRRDGEVFGLSMCSKPLVLDITPWDLAPWSLAGLTEFPFDSASGLEAIAIQSTAGFATDDGQLIALNKGEMFTEPDILAGRWRGARYRIFLYRWDVESPTIENDVETLKVGTLGEVQIDPVTLSIELHCQKRLLQVPVGIVSQPTCRARFGSQGDGQCNVTLAPYVHTFQITTVMDARTFACADAVQAPDAFGLGEVEFLNGANIGIRAVVESFAGGQFVLTAPLLFPLEVGDEVRAVEGCRKRLEQDCRDRYDNVLNFQGEPHRATRDRIISGVGG